MRSSPTMSHIARCSCLIQTWLSTDSPWLHHLLVCDTWDWPRWDGGRQGPWFRRISSSLLGISPPILFDGVPIERVKEHKHLGIYLTSDLSWSRHVQYISKRANSKLSVLRSIKYLSRPVLDILYKQQIRSIIDYGMAVYQTLKTSLTRKNLK